MPVEEAARFFATVAGERAAEEAEYIRNAKAEFAREEEVARQMRISPIVDSRFGAS
jgi:hypothetical protein